MSSSEALGRMTTDDSGFTRELARLINRHGIDASWNTPDFILADHMIKALTSFGVTLEEVRRWHGWPTLAEKHAAMFQDTIEGGSNVG